MRAEIARVQQPPSSRLDAERVALVGTVVHRQRRHAERSEMQRLAVRKRPPGGALDRLGSCEHGAGGEHALGIGRAVDRHGVRKLADQAHVIWMRVTDDDPEEIVAEHGWQLVVVCSQRQAEIEHEPRPGMGKLYATATDLSSPANDAGLHQTRGRRPPDEGSFHSASGRRSSS